MSVGIGLLVSVFLCEITARVYFFGSDAFSIKKVNSFTPIGTSGFLKKAENNKVLYELKPNIDAFFKLKKFVTNSHGQRDEEYSLSKPKNTIRGLVIGDSFTMASGVNIENAYHSVMEKQLNEESEDINYEFINFGVGGYNLLNYAGILEEKVSTYNPDFVIIGFCAFNDYFLPSERHYEGDFRVKVQESRRKPFYSFYFGGLIQNMLQKAENDSRLFEIQPEQRLFIDEMFQGFNSFSENYDIPVLITVLSVLPDNGNLAIFEEVARRNNLPMNNSYGQIDPENLSSYTISRLDHHPNKKAHGVYAQNLMEFDKFRSILEKLRSKMKSSSERGQTDN